MQCNVTCVSILTPPRTSIIYSSPWPRCCRVVCASITIAAAWLRHRTDYCASLLERREPRSVPSPRGHSMVCATVCLTVKPSFSDITDISTTSHSSETDSSRTPLYRVAKYGDDIIYRELNLDENCPAGSESRTHNLPNSCDDKD